MKTRIYFKPMPSGQQPTVDVDIPFEAVQSMFSPAIVAQCGWPIFTFDGKRCAYNPADVDCIGEVE